MNSNHISGAEIVIRCLHEEKVKFVFGYPGGAVLNIYDAVFQQNKFKHVLVRHEQAAVHAADAYSRSTGKVGVALVTSGPGATNAVTGIATAYMDSIPMVIISGQVPTYAIGQDAFQECDTVGITRPCVKHNFLVKDIKDIASTMKKAFYVASSGRPGPVLVDIPKDITAEKYEFNYPKSVHLRSYNPIVKGHRGQIKKALSLLLNAKRPMIYSGGGAVLGDASSQLTKFVRTIGAPITSTLMGLGGFPASDKQFLGMLGMHGNYGPNVLTNECDVLIAVGMRFDDRVTGRLDKYAKQAKIIHLDIDPSEIDKNVLAHVGVWGDCKETLPLLTMGIEQKDRSEWLNVFAGYAKEEYEQCIHEEMNPSSEQLSMAEVIRTVNEITKGDAVMVTDVGQHQMVTCRYAKFNQTRSNVTSGGLGTMGFGLPAAIGAKFGAQDRTVIAVIGDGGIQMTLQEFGTIMQTGIDVKVMILNNEFLGMVRQWQQLFMEKRYSFVDIESPDYVMLANSYRIAAAKVSKREELADAVAKMLAHKGSYVLEVMVGKENNVFPMVPQGCSVSEIRLK